MATIDIPAQEDGKVRVFALSMSDPEAEALTNDPALLAETLGTDDVAAGQVEVFRTADLEGVGLASYLIDGKGAVASQVDRDRAKLSALDGWVMVATSAAFEDGPRTLAPVPALTLIGTYDEERPDVSQVELTSDAAQPYTGTPQMTPPVPPKGKAGGTLVVAGIVVVLIILLLWAFS